MSLAIEVLNAIRNNADAEYQERVPPAERSGAEPFPDRHRRRDRAGDQQMPRAGRERHPLHRLGGRRQGRRGSRARSRAPV